MTPNLQAESKGVFCGVFFIWIVPLINPPRRFCGKGSLGTPTPPRQGSHMQRAVLCSSRGLQATEALRKVHCQVQKDCKMPATSSFLQNTKSVVLLEDLLYSSSPLSDRFLPFNRCKPRISRWLCPTGA